MENPIKNDWKNKIYPFVFQEEFYRKSINSKKNFSYLEINQVTKKTSFLQIKRAIHSLRYRNSLEEKKFFFNNKKPKSLNINKYNQLTLSSLECIFKHKNFEKENYNNNSIFDLNQSHKYNSIQLSLVSFEYEWFSYQLILEGQMYFCLHIEIIIRILRKIVHDVSFIHYLREFLYEFSLDIFNQKSINNNSISNWKKTSNFFFNISKIEFHKLFLIEYSKNFFLRPCRNSLITDKRSFFEKIRKLNRLESQLKRKKIYLIMNSKSTLLYEDTKAYKYIETRQNWFLNIQIRNYLLNSIEKRYINYIENRLGYLHKSTKIHLVTSGCSSYLVGYKIIFQLKKLKFSIFNIKNIFHIWTKKPSLGILMPFSSMISILALYGFCYTNGYPITKLGWTTWSDAIIITRFKHLRNSLISYYSGAINQKELSHIQHILHYSCAKTLACKHKTNLRRIWQKYGKNLSTFLPSKSKPVSFDILRKKSFHDLKKNRRFWNLYFKQPDKLGISVEKKYLN